MKEKRIVLGIVMVIFCYSGLACQAAEALCENKTLHCSHESDGIHGGIAKMINLSPEQKELHKKMMELHDQFVKTLSEEQKKIFNSSGGHHHAQMAHETSKGHDELAMKMKLTKEQLELHNLVMELHNQGKEAEMKKAHDRFVESLTDEQKKLMEELAHP